MSQADAALVRRMYDAFRRGDMEAAVELFAPDVTVDATARPEGEVGHGREALWRIVASWVAAFDEWSEEIESIRDLGEQVLVAATQRGRGKGSGLDVETRYALLYRVRDGRIDRMTFYGDVASALEAAASSGES